MENEFKKYATKHLGMSSTALESYMNITSSYISPTIIEERQYEGKTGIYHFSNEGVCSWYDFTIKIAELAGNTTCDIQPCHSNEFPSPVKRPAYSVLDKTKIKETFGIKIPYWVDSLKKCMKNLQEQDK